jgi:hypothetical protein
MSARHAIRPVPVLVVMGLNDLYASEATAVLRRRVGHGAAHAWAASLTARLDPRHRRVRLSGSSPVHAARAGFLQLRLAGDWRR